MTTKDIQILAGEYGLILTEKMEFNEMGIDFKVGFATDINGQKWLLRIPRRDDLVEQIEMEKRILRLVNKHLSVEVPNWKIATSKLIAYPVLEDIPALTFNEFTYELSWHMHQESQNYVPSLAKILVELHGIPEIEVMEHDLKIMTPIDLRPEISDRLQLVKSELGISHNLEERYRKWLDHDQLWPDFTSFIHGDLYAGHVMTSTDGIVSGIIDWSTGQVSDISQDFSGHLTVFGEESLKALITEYEKQGGKVWDKLFDQVRERAAAAPLAYGVFAIETNDQTHIAAAKAQLGNA